MSEHVIEVNNDTFQTEVVAADLPVIVDFWAEWCGPCLDLMPIFTKLAPCYAGRVKFVKINVDENKELAAQLEVTSFPTLLLLKNGTPVARMLGSRCRSELTNLLDQHVTTFVEEGVGQTRRGFQAFRGNAGLKASIIERVQRLIADDKIVSMKFTPNFDATSGQYSLMTAATPTIDPKAYEDELGIPWELGRLEAFVHILLARGIENGARGFRGPSSQYPVDWWRALPLGKDLQPVVPAFLDWWLRDLADSYFSPMDEAVSCVAKTIAGLHARASRGDMPTKQEWQVARHQAGALVKRMDENQDGEDISPRMLLSAAEALAWPPEELDMEIGGAVGFTFLASATRASHAIYTKEEWSRREALLTAASKRMEDMPNPTRELMQADADVRAYEEFQESMRPREMVAMGEAQNAYGERLHPGLMLALKSVR